MGAGLKIANVSSFWLKIYVILAIFQKKFSLDAIDLTADFRELQIKGGGGSFQPESVSLRVLTARIVPVLGWVGHFGPQIS